VAVLALLPVPAARAELHTVTYRQGPIAVAPYQVRFTTHVPGAKHVPAPDIDGHIVEMHARVVDESGRQIPVRRLMLHHVLYKNRGRFDGELRDPVCGGPAQSFYGTGEENQTLRFPPGYGYPVHRGDRWQTAWMLMNHRNVPDSAYVEYRAVIDDSPGIHPVTPYWLRVTGCPGPGRIDPIFDVPGGGPAGSTFTKSMTWRMPEGGRLIAAGGHAHGGSKDLTIHQPTCGNRELMPSHPLYGNPDHAVYNVLPVLHEPGPIDMSWVQTATGIPVGKGELLRLTSYYDGRRPHTRVMGIMHLYVAHDPAVTLSCAPLPADLQNTRLDLAGRTDPPRVRVPLTGLDRRGRARRILRPPGRTRRLDHGVSVLVKGFAFDLPNLSLPLGAQVRWRFRDPIAHNVTLANGPVGFSSYNIARGRSYVRRFTEPGIYRLFCSLHPVQMTQAITVRRRR
jgi:plastocyanin